MPARAAARRLAENRPNDRIVVLDAHEVGENASGRNSGFAIDLPHNIGSSLAELAGSQRYIRLSRAAIDNLDKTIKATGIDCQWSRRGKYHAAVSPKGRTQVLEPFARVGGIEGTVPLAGRRAPQEGARPGSCAGCETREGRIDRIERRIEIAGPLNAAQRQRPVEITEKVSRPRTRKGEQILTRLAD